MTTPNKVLDLDDTLYSEFHYLKYAYRQIAESLSVDDQELYELMLAKYYDDEDVFGFLTQKYNISKAALLKLYRFHQPIIELYSGVQVFLDSYLSTS